MKVCSETFPICYSLNKKRFRDNSSTKSEAIHQLN